jgi:hypothetical protein
LRQSGIGLVEHAVPLVKIMEEPGQLMGIKSEKVRGQVLRGISNNLRELVELLDERKFLVAVQKLVSSAALSVGTDKLSN